MESCQSAILSWLGFEELLMCSRLAGSCGILSPHAKSTGEHVGPGAQETSHGEPGLVLLWP